MPQKVPTSFVPKQPVRTVRRPRVRGPLSIFAVASLVLFFAAVLLAGVVFGYEFFLKQSRDAKAGELQTIQNSVEPQAVEDLARLSQRLVIARELLEDHVAVSAVFSMLERDTVQSVTFEGLELVTIPSGDVEITMQGRAQNFNALAYQSVVFRDNPFLRNQIFEDITVTEEEDVTFTFTGIISSTLVRAQSGQVVQVAPNEVLESLFEGEDPEVPAEENPVIEEGVEDPVVEEGNQEEL